MLETLVMDHHIDKTTWKQAHKRLRDRFYGLAYTCWRHHTPVLIILEGWDLSGKGDCIRFITKRQDPRGIKTDYFSEPRSHEKQRHWLHRFWIRLPKYGRMSIWDTSWYRRVLSERVNGEVTGDDVENAIRDIVKTERLLAMDGMVIVKFMLHISKEEQRKRLKKQEKHPVPGYRVTESEWGLHHQYDTLRVAAEEMLERTDTALAPWHLVPADHRRHAQVTLFETLCDRIEQHFRERNIAFRTGKHDTQSEA